MADLGDFDAYDPGDESAGEGDSGAGDATAAEPDTTQAHSEDATATGSASRADGPDADRFDAVAVDPGTEQRGIGTLAASEGLTISERDDDTRLRAYVTAANRSAVRLGRYLLVDYPPEPGGARHGSSVG
jgi:hypothetical protein